MSTKSNEWLPTPSASMMSEQDFVQAKHNSKTRVKYKDANFVQLLPTPMAGFSKASHSKPNGNYDGKIRKLYSQQGSHANHFPTQGEKEARQTVAFSGLKLSQSLKPSSPIGSFLRTCLESSIWYSPIVELRWQ